MSAFWTIGLALMLLASAGVGAGEALYRWTDDQGQVHFSDRVPDREARSVQTLPMPETGTFVAPGDDRYSVMNQSRRMRAERQARETARRRAYLAELEERQRLAEIAAAEARARQLDAEAQRARDPVYVLPWGWSGRHPHHRRPPPPVPQLSPQSPPSQMSLRRPGRSLKPVAPAEERR
ncbi:DUF4124 domain-containing protein [Thiorhodococcus fuscus]|uniref:DUF4124 domain-containing protein n=1 Tax=Thiorhodococcus fuscus TaxID=527200 RepID=A0ABW4Y5M8_9GAMM